MDEHIESLTQRKSVSTLEKALAINLQSRKYGAFAEIGAGQEVVRWFFQAGGASRTIAKSISAYDMTVSDAIYGTADRYVSRGRLTEMLDHEYSLTIERLNEKRGADTEFFVFADTVAARNFKGGNESHGWMGVRFQTQPHGEPSEIVMHVRMLDARNVEQQEALGVVGINLIHSAFFLYPSPEAIMESLLDNLTTRRIDVDMIKFSGPVFQDVDHRLMALKLVQLGLSDAAMFSCTGEVLQPSEALWKRPVLVERGSFRPVTNVNIDMLNCAREQFEQQPNVEDDDVFTLMEITMRNLLESGEIDNADFLARADVLAATGATVLISNYFEYYRLAAYLQRYTQQPIALAMGVPSLRDLFDEKYYENLDGGILESFGRLFKNDLKLYIYPVKDEDERLITVQKLKVAPHLQSLYNYLVENESILSLDFFDRNYLHIFSRDILDRIADNDCSWEEMVPVEVTTLIKERGFFGYCDKSEHPKKLEKAPVENAPVENAPVENAPAQIAPAQIAPLVETVEVSA